MAGYISFYKFVIRNYKGDDSPAGDLAQDMSDDRHFPKRSANYQQIKEYLLKSGACNECLDAFNDCWSEFREWKESEAE